MERRDLLKLAGAGALGAGPAAMKGVEPRTPAVNCDVRAFGAKGDGSTIDSPAINRAIEAAAASGGGTIYFPAGVYLCYSIRLKSHVGLHLDHGATILAAPSPMDPSVTTGYDAPEPQGACEPYQDFGHNHWHNSLIWGEGLEDLAITGRGLIWGRGLTRGWDKEPGRADTRQAGVGNKAIALKNCRNVLLRDFSILEGGWFGILATGVDNLVIDALTIDTNRDGMDLDCCRNARVSNCTVNSPWDDAICPKSSYALGERRITEHVTIANCFVTGGYRLGSVLDATWKPLAPAPDTWFTGRIKLGTESNGGFRNIAISNCVFERCQGFALESEDGAEVEDISVVGLTMRGIVSAPIFLRLGRRLRGPAGTRPGTMRRVLIANVVSSGASALPSIVSGVPGSAIEDVKIADCHFEQLGAGQAEWAALEPPEREADYPDPEMFGALPASGLFARHARNLELSGVEFACRAADPRPAVWLRDVEEAEFFRLRLKGVGGPAFALHEVRRFRALGSAHVEDTRLDAVEHRTIAAS